MKLYGKHNAGSLDELRYVSYKRRLHSNTKKKKVDPRKLPPSSAAASFHSLRVYHQVQEWRENDLDPLEFGWYQMEDRLEPLTFEGPIAPPHILSTILCKCKKTNYKSGNCACNALGLRCTEVCECGVNCDNHAPITTNEVFEEEEDEGEDHLDD